MFESVYLSTRIAIHFTVSMTDSLAYKNNRSKTKKEERKKERKEKKIHVLLGVTFPFPFMSMLLYLTASF